MANPAWKVRVMSVPGADTDLSLWVQFDTLRVLFGAGEGTQRVLLQKGQSMRSLGAICLPSGKHNRGGLPGLLMTAADAGMTGMDVIGPPDTTHSIAVSRSCLLRSDFVANAVSFPREAVDEEKELFKSRQLSINGIMLRPDEAPRPSPPIQITRNRPASIEGAQMDKWLHQIMRDMFPLRGGGKSMFHGLPRPGLSHARYPLPVQSDADVKTDMIYICRAAEVRGKFNVQKAKALNVPNGPIRATLVNGEPIEFDDPTAPGGRRVVGPDEVLEGGGPGAIMMLVTCHQYNLHRLLASVAFAPYQVGEAQQHKVAKIVHQVDRAVWEDPRYRAWMETFGNDVEHGYVDPIGNYQTMFTSSATLQLKLNMLDPDFFPLPHYLTEPLPSSVAPPSSGKILRPDDTFQMYPTAPTTVSPRGNGDPEFPLTEDDLVRMQASLPKTYPEYAKLVSLAQSAVQQEVERRKHVPVAVGDDIVVTTLGTGSALPSKYRNVSATHVDVPGWGGFLLDCGEGTLGQLRRRYGPEGLKQKYEELKIIFVSHMHGDHHLGLSQILRDRFDNGVHSKVYLIAPPQIALILMESAAWQNGVPREALDNLVWINPLLMKNGWTAGGKAPTKLAPGAVKRGSLVDFAEVLAAKAKPEPVRTGSLFDDFQDPRVSEGLVKESEVVVEPPQAAVPVESSEQGTEEEVDPIEREVAAGKRLWPFRNPFGLDENAVQRGRAQVSTLLEDMGLAEIGAPSVIHRGACHGFVLQHKSGWKVVYSGDTKPSDELVKHGKNATILIHEATMEDEKAELAEVKAHSTFGQAISVAERMNAKYLVLNHFSQRYPKAPPSLADFRRSPSPERGVVYKPDAHPIVAITFDLQSMRAGDMWKMAYYFDTIEDVFGENDEDAEEQAYNDPQPRGRDTKSRENQGNSNGRAPRTKGKGPRKQEDGNSARITASEPLGKKAWGLRKPGATEPATHGTKREPVSSDTEAKPAAKRGRATKTVKPAATVVSVAPVAEAESAAAPPAATAAAEGDPEPAVKRSRGRPKKAPEDPVAAELAAMRAEMAAMQSELVELRRSMSAERGDVDMAS